jgi:hypothetical protein
VDELSRPFLSVKLAINKSDQFLRNVLVEDFLHGQGDDDFAGNELHHSSFDQPVRLDQLADHYKFCEHQFAVLFLRPGGDEFPPAVLSGGNAVIISNAFF